MAENSIKVPKLIVKQINIVENEKVNLSQKLGREPTDEEIAQSLTWSVKRVKSLKNIAQTPLGELYNNALLGDFIKEHNIKA